MPLSRSPVRSEERTFKSVVKDNLEIDQLCTKEISVVKMATTQSISLRDALEVVPTFNGTNIPIEEFLMCLEEGKEMLPGTAEGNFIKLVRTRLTGEAKQCISREKFAKVADLGKFLKAIFPPKGKIQHLRAELGSIAQGSRESVVGYLNRVRNLGERIIDAYRTTHSDEAVDAFSIELDKEVKDWFVDGLRDEIEIKMPIVSTLSDAGTLAISIENKLAYRSQRKRGSLLESKAPTRNVRINHYQSEGKCQICNKLGHLANNCRFRNQPYNRYDRPIRVEQGVNRYNRQYQNRTDIDSRRDYPVGYNRDKWVRPDRPQENYSHRGNFNTRNEYMGGYRDSACTYCRKSGHRVETCFIRQRDNEQAINHRSHRDDNRYVEHRGPNTNVVYNRTLKTKNQNQGNSKAPSPVGASREATATNSKTRPIMKISM